MAKPRAMVLFAPGTNCDEETQHCLNISGAKTDRVHIQDLFDGSVTCQDYQILAVPGGFSYGDCIAAGRILANHLGTTLTEVIREFIQNDKLVIGICNGFQVLARLGLFDGDTGNVTLAQNESAKFECRWVRLAADPDTETPFLDGVDRLWLPVAHAEGRLIGSPETIAVLKEKRQVALRYAAHDDTSATPNYPENPNGSMDDIAGMTDTTGRVFGLMPHPERFMSPDLLFAPPSAMMPQADTAITGLRIFENAVKHFA